MNYVPGNNNQDIATNYTVKKEKHLLLIFFPFMID